jgi:RHS repeat-associated protein
MGCIKEADSSDYQATHKTSPPPAQSNQDSTGDPVNVVTGAFTLSEQDITFPTQRLRLELIRHYNNQLQDSDPNRGSGGFGRGWTHSFNLHLEPGPEPGQVTYVDDHGSPLTFLEVEARDAGGHEKVYKAPPGALGMELRQKSNGEFQLRQIDGLTAEFDTHGRIKAMIRPGPEAESRLDFRYDERGRLVEVSGAGGRAIRFEYQGNEPLIRFATDHTGRRWQYRYNKWQELVEVRDPARRVRRYAYRKWDGWVATAKGQTEPRTIRAMSQVFCYSQENDPRESIAELTNQYTSDRRVYCQTDALGNKTRFEYNRFTRTTYVTDPAGWTTVYCYDDAGNTTKVRRPGGSTTEYIFDTQRNLVAEIDAFGNHTEYVEFKEPHRLDYKQEFGRRAIANRSDYVTPGGDDILVGYDSRGNRPLVRDALGNTTYFYDYTRFGRPGRIVRPDGSEIHFAYDERSSLPVRIQQTISSVGTEPLTVVQEWVYDRWGNMTRQSEWAENTNGPASPKRILALAYDELGHHPLCRRIWIEADGHGENFADEEHYEWDALGRLVSVKTLRRSAPDGQAAECCSRFGYDVLGRQVWAIDPAGTATCWLLDLYGRTLETFLVANAASESLTSVSIERRLERRRWAYDEMGRELRFTDPTGGTVVRKWDERGLCTSVSDPLGYAIEYEYDRDGNQVAQRLMTGHETRTHYDHKKPVITQTDSLGKTTVQKYDPLGRLESLTEGTGEQAPTTMYRYDPLGRIVHICYADGAYEQFGYGERGNILQRTRGQGNAPALSIEAFTYDGLGRLTGVQLGRPGVLSQQFTLEYEDAARRVKVYDALGSAKVNSYDSTGNLIHTSDAEGRRLHLEYDGKGRLLRRWSPDRSVESHYQYDVSGRLVEATEGSVSYRWRYDAAGRIVRHDQTVGERTESVLYEHDAAGRTTSKRIGQEWWMTYHYTSGSPFISKIEIPGAAIAIKTDQAGRITEECWSNGGRTVYSYGPDGPLTGLESFDEHGQMVFGQRLARDNRGRTVRELRRYPNLQALYQYHYDPLDRLERVRRKESNADSEFRRYVYDERGNRLEEYRDGLLYASYRYDASNRLVEIRDGQGNTTPWEYDRNGSLIRKASYLFEYDAAQRLRRVMSTRVAEPVVSYHYAATDERALITRPNEVERSFYDGVEEVLSESAGGRRCAYWGFQVDALLASSMARQPAQRVYTTAQGSVVGIGKASELRDFDPFGNLITGNTSSSPVGFCGKRFDQETGLYYNRARYYDPLSGRFTQPDAKGILDGANVYVYGRNNPLSYFDQYGFSSVKDSQGKIASAFDIRFASPMDFNLEGMRGMKLEHTDASGWRTVGETYLVNSHLEHYSGGKLVGTTYQETSRGGGWLGAIMGQLFGEGPTHLAHYDASGHRIGTTYQETSHLAHYDTANQRIGTTYQETSSGGGWMGAIMGQLFGSGGTHLGHYNASGTQATGRTYIS